MHAQNTPNLTVRTITLTPDLAKTLLERNPRNRNISRTNLQLLVRAITNGEWTLNGEAVKVNTEGYILDGQHRCMAVVESGIAIETLLVEGLPDDTQDTMDQGKARSLADVLSIRGELNSVGLAALIKRHVVVQRAGLATAFMNGSGGQGVTTREGLTWLDLHPWVRDYVTPGKALGRHTPLSGSSAGLLMKVFDDIDTADSAWFWERLADGVELSAGHPVHVLRETFKRISDDVKGERNQRYLAALTIKAWNAYRAGSTISQLKYRPGGATPERFPEPR